ncbi:MAG: peptidoglycan-binding domain-containing protein, partial [Acetobacteraceae bacterium]
MIKVRSLSAILALGALAALPGCSMFGGGDHEMAAAAPAPAPAPAPMAQAPEMSNPQQNALSHSLVRQVQTKLKSNHMYSGRVDGVWGPMTRRGVMRFQEKNGMQGSGELDDATLQAMNLSPAGGMSGGAMSDSGANGTNM